MKAGRSEMKCQMTVGEYNWYQEAEKCNRPAKFKVPGKPKMGIEFVCGIHARSLNLMFERTGQTIRCQRLSEEVT